MFRTAWRWGFVLQFGTVREHVARLTIGVYIYDCEWTPWEFYCQQGFSSTWCPGGTVNLALGPIRAVYVRGDDAYKGLCS